MNEPKNHPTPYQLPEERFTAMREQIRRHTTGREQPRVGIRRPVVRLCLAAAAVVIVVAGGLLFADRRCPAAKAPQPDLEQMLSTASPETIRQAAAENYDAIIYDQQL